MINNLLNPKGLLWSVNYRWNVFFYILIFYFIWITRNFKYNHTNKTMHITSFQRILGRQKVDRGSRKNLGFPSSAKLLSQTGCHHPSLHMSLTGPMHSKKMLALAQSMSGGCIFMSSRLSRPIHHKKYDS